MNAILLQLLSCAFIVIAIPALDSEGKYLYVAENMVTDFAVLSGSKSDNLPGEITICSSVTTSGAYTEVLSPFQLLHQNGEPWISLFAYVRANNFTHHQIWLMVSSISISFSFSCLFSRVWLVFQPMHCNGLPFVCFFLRVVKGASCNF